MASMSSSGKQAAKRQPAGTPQTAGWCQETREQGEGFEADNEQVEPRRLTLGQMGLRLIQLVVHQSIHRS